MPLFSIQNGQVSSISEQPFKLEKDIQRLVEQNLNRLVNLEPVKSEFAIKGKRIDTLAFDLQTMSFVIIEYKRDRNASVVDQGFGYLSIMLENKAEFIVEYNETLGKNLKREEVDWSQSRVIFVAPSFTENQKLATNFKDVAIELWEIKRYDNDILSLNQIKKTSKESIKQVAEPGGEIEEVTKEIKVYTEDDHLNGIPEQVVELYERFRSAIVQLGDDIDVVPRKVRVAFKYYGKGFCDISIFRNNLKLWINLKKGQLNDPRILARDVSEIGHWGLGDYELQIESDENLEYIMSLVKQAYSALK